MCNVQIANPNSPERSYELEHVYLPGNPQICVLQNCHEPQTLIHSGHLGTKDRRAVHLLLLLDPRSHADNACGGDACSFS